MRSSAVNHYTRSVFFLNSRRSLTPLFQQTQACRNYMTGYRNYQRSSLPFMLSKQSIRSFRASSTLFGQQTKDLYAILNVDKTASEADIKKQFLKLARQYHPDVNKSKEATQKFSEINEAYETLNNAERRRIYDLTGMSSNEQSSAEQQGMNFNGFGPFGFGFGGAKQQEDFRSFEEILKEFEEFFKMENNSSHGTTVLKGKDIFIELSIDFLEAFKGTTKHVQFSRNDVCTSCKGKQTIGSEKTCVDCNGIGVVSGKIAGVEAEMDCATCEGSGIVKDICSACNGSGALRKVVREIVKIPRGVNTGINLRMSGKGNWSKSGKQGDLMIKINVRDHNYFQREGDDIITKKFITVTQAILGAKVNVSTLHGEEELVIKQGIQSGESMTIPNKGFYKVQGKENECGNHIVKIEVVFPTKLNETQKKALQQYAAVEPKVNE